MSNLAKDDYLVRVNRAIDYILQHLGEPLKLDDVARVACFSPYHFHRIFRGLIGEPLNAFIKRVRLERAMALLAFRDGSSLTDIALACGFSSSSDFSRSFRKELGVPPSAFDVERFRRSRRAQMLDSLTTPETRHLLERLPRGENPDGFTVTIRDVPPRRVAYIRVHRPYRGDRVPAAAARLVAWAQHRGLAGGQWLGYQWDIPELVPLDKCRYDVAVEVPPTVTAGGEVNVMDFPAMTIGEIDIAGAIDLEQRALDWLYDTWLPQSGYAPDDQPGFEAWNGKPFEHGPTHFELRLQLPVVDAAKPL